MEIKSAKKGEKIDVVIDTTSGDFAAAIKTGKKEDLVVTLKKEGVAFSSQLLEIEKNPPPTDVPLKIPALEIKEIKIGETYTLNNIYFGSNSASLEQRSKAVLKEFAEYLKNNKNLKIEIYGHTDNVGDRNSNLGLSKERALVVLEALTEEFGVPKSQVRGFSGFGPDKPVADNGTESGRAKNRRTEFAVVEK